MDAATQAKNSRVGESAAAVPYPQAVTVATSRFAPSSGHSRRVGILGQPEGRGRVQQTVFGKRLDSPEEDEKIREAGTARDARKTGKGS